MAEGNRYTSKVKSKSILELQRIIDNYKDYDEMLVSASVIELESRGEETIDGKKALSEIEKKKFKKEEQEKINKEPFIPENLPRTIKFSAYLIYMNTLIWLVMNLFSTHIMLRLGGLALILGIGLTVLLAITVHKGSNAARWIYTSIITIGLIFNVFHLFSGFVLPLNSIFQTLISLTAVIFLFQPESKKWYSGAKDE